MDNDNRFENRARGAFTALAVLLLVAWLSIMAWKSGTPPRYNADGDLVFDQFERLSNVLPVIVALVSTAFGYWFGAHGKAVAERTAEAAQQVAKTSIAQAEVAQSQVATAREVLAQIDPQVVAEAQQSVSGNAADLF